jgi:tetratricopeptide (TPR) repeat protein
VPRIEEQRAFLTQAVGTPPPPPTSNLVPWAREVLAPARLESDDNPFLHLALIAAAGSPEEAIARCDAAVAGAPRSANVWAARANIRQAHLAASADPRGELTRLQADLTQALTLSSDDVEALMVRGWLEADVLQDAAAAIATYDRVLAISPYDPLALRYRAVNRARRNEPVDTDWQLAALLLGDS